MFSRTCPSCKCRIEFTDRTTLIFNDKMDCPKCGSFLTPTKIGCCVGAPFGGLAWFLSDEYFLSLGVSGGISMSLGFIVCMLIIKLGYPFGSLMLFDNNNV